MLSRRTIVISLFLTVTTAAGAGAQERAYFVTYDHYLEERGNLEIAVASTTGVPKSDRSAYTAPWIELEYGVTGWWTTEVYLEGVATRHDGHGFTGWRFENRFRPLRNEHRVNPVVYVEYESINEASRMQKEIVGAGTIPFEPIHELRREHAHELEGKLILSSLVSGFNVAQNIIIEKNLSESEGVEFGYSIGVARHLGTLARSNSCRLCAENLVIGAELYGGLGSSEAFARKDQRHYLAPVFSWRLTNRVTVKASAGFGVTKNSDHILLRAGATYELPVGGGR